MTVFMVSLFLPYTVDFQAKEQEDGEPLRPSSPPTPVAVRDRSDDDVVTLFSHPSSVPTPGPPAKGGYFDFVPHKPISSKGSITEFVGFTSAATPNEAHSPVWGRTSYFNQPELRAEEPPSASIVPLRRLNHRAGLASKDSRTSSHEREALRTAEWSIAPGERGNVGLRNAVYAATKSGSLQEVTWVGTIGMPTDALEKERKVEISEKLQTDHDSLAVFAKDSDLNGHYSHFCKIILWPVFHYQIPDNPKSKAYQDHSWVYYVTINELFADKVIKNYKKGDIIWIHDYHLLLVPGMIRKKIPDAQIGFFLHIAFPSSEVFRCLAVREQLLEGMLGANLVGFQTAEYCHHFLQTCSRLLCVEALENGVQLEERFVNVAKFPIGIEPEILDAQRRDPEVLKWLEKLRDKYAGKHLIVARDKLDHVRGVRNKLLAYELLLNQHPEFRGNVVLIQVATSTTEQVELESTVADIVTRISAQYSTLAHQPLVYLKQDLGYAQYLAMITAADALMITSLREGMNLTSHEFIVCQDGEHGTGRHRAKKHGSLILSEFTGSAAIFDGNDLAVNPWDYRQCAEAMRQALTMPAEEKIKRWTALRDIVMQQTAGHWLESFLESLQRAYDEHSRQHTVAIPRLSINELAPKYKNAKTRLFMLDYEGTLTAHGSPLSITYVSPQRTINVLNSLLEAPENVVYVMSGQKPEELDSLFRRVPGLGLVAENGCFIKEAGADSWYEAADLEKMMEWKDSILKILQYYLERIEGSMIEERHCSILFHCVNAKDTQSVHRLAGDCATQINDACQNLKVHAVPWDSGVLIESTEWSKKTAATRILERLARKTKAANSNVLDFLLVAGNAREDEVIYRWANQLGKVKAVRDVITVSVSTRNTEAQATLTQGVTGVLSALHKLATS